MKRSPKEQKKYEKLCKLRKEALAHYDRMINIIRTVIAVSPYFSKQQPNFSLMEDLLGEDYSSEYCGYCKTFDRYGVAYDRTKCATKCPLGDDEGKCCHGLYEKMYDARTWKAWVVEAQRVREFIRIRGADISKLK